jgi:heme/copper-type cytochrome/quinol oxidase subunit 2
MKLSKEQNTAFALIILSVVVAIGGPVMAMAYEVIVGWDREVYQVMMCLFPIGLVALFASVGFMFMVEAREQKEHEAEMESIRRRQIEDAVAQAMIL